jgi:hypothetical protein
LHREAREVALDAKYAGLEDPTTAWTESRKLNDHDPHIDTFALAIYAIAATLGSLVGAGLVLLLF